MNENEEYLANEALDPDCGRPLANYFMPRAKFLNNTAVFYL